MWLGFSTKQKALFLLEKTSTSTKTIKRCLTSWLRKNVKKKHGGHNKEICQQQK
jgi:hypothetical protein